MGESGVLVILCPHCMEPPGLEFAMIFAPEVAPYECRECGQEFNSPSFVPQKQLQEAE